MSKLDSTLRALSRRFNGFRIGVTGQREIDAGPFTVQPVDRKLFVGDSLLRQTEAKCPAGRTPLTIVHKPGTRHAADVVLMRLKDFEEWHGGRK